MTGAGCETSDVSVVRPTEPVQPDHERARRAIVALRDGRLADAETNIAAIGGDTEAERAWKCYLAGQLSAQRERIGEAIEHFRECCMIAADVAALSRLVAGAWEWLGLLHRRREDTARATHAHDRAYRLRLEIGSAEECWESTHSLGLTAALCGAHDEAVRWLGEAVRWVDQIPESPDLFRAKSLAALADLEVRAARMSQALQAARAAYDAACRYDRSGVNAVRAEVLLGRVLLRSAESLLTVDPGGASTMLDEAMAQLQSAKDGLLAFGLAADADTRWCDELIDFAERLRVEL